MSAIKKLNKKLKQNQENERENEDIQDESKNKSDVNDNKIKEKKEKKNESLSDETTREKSPGAANDVIIEYMTEKITITDLAPMYRQFRKKTKMQLHQKSLANKLQEDGEDDELDEENKDDK